MPYVYTVDASVFLNAYNEAEGGHEQSHAFLARAHKEFSTLIEPSLVLVEVAAALARGRDDAELARSFAIAVSKLPGLILIPLDEPLALEAAELAVDLHPRAGDAVYGAVARRFNAVLVTRDREQQQRLSPVLTAYTPEEAMAAQAQ